MVSSAGQVLSAGTIVTKEGLEVHDLEKAVDVSIRLSDLLARRDPGRALDFALRIADPEARVRATQSVFRAWPEAEKEKLAPAVRRLLATAGAGPNQLPTMLLSALPATKEELDASLTRELVQRVLSMLDDQKSGPPSPKLYRLLARLDRGSAEHQLSKLLRTRSKDEAERLANFAEGVSELEPDLTWKALVAIDGKNRRFVPTRAAIFRQLAAKASIDKEERLRFGLDLVASTRKADLSVISDAVVGLAAVDRRAAIDGASPEALIHWQTGYRLGLQLGQAPRVGFIGKDRRSRWQSLAFDLVRLDLALSGLEYDPGASLAMLRGFDREVWSSLVSAILRGPAESYRGDLSTVRDYVWLTGLLERVGTVWPGAVLALTKGGGDSDGSHRGRLIQVSEWLDSEAVQMVVAKGVLDDEGRRAQLWRVYLPFMLTRLGLTLVNSDSAASGEAFRRCQELARGLPTPAREWALSWNAAAWTAVGDEHALMGAREAANRLKVLKQHKPWHRWLPLLVEQVARFEPATALSIARSEDAGPARAEALAAVLRGISN